MVRKKKERSEEPLLFDPAEAMPFKPGLFDGKPSTDPEIAKLTVKALHRTAGNRALNEAELEIEQGIMLLNSHRDKLEELAELDEPHISKKKIALLITILGMFVAFIVIFFVASKLLGNSSSVRHSAKISHSP